VKKLLGWTLSLGFVIGLLGTMTGCPDSKPKPAEKKADEKKADQKKGDDKKS